MQTKVFIYIGFVCKNMSWYDTTNHLLVLSSGILIFSLIKNLVYYKYVCNEILCVMRSLYKIYRVILLMSFCSIATFTHAQIGEVTEQSLTSGDNHSCVIDRGVAKCWGSNGSGQLGDGSSSNRFTAVQVVEGSLSTGVMTVIEAGNSHTCAIQNGAVKCWGNNSRNQLGDGSLTTGVTRIAAGYRHTCAIQRGAAKCWGWDNQGALGDGDTVVTGGSSGSSMPVQVFGLESSVTAITVGDLHGCAIQSGAAKCWGRGGNGQLGNGASMNSSTPEQVLDLESGVTAIASGPSRSSFSTCAIQSGAAKCWGRGEHGQLGDGLSMDSSMPVQVEGLRSGVTAIKVGAVHACAVQNGAAKCWGAREHTDGGQLGNGINMGSPTPVQVLGLTSGVTEIAAGTVHTCAIHYGFIKCWGHNADGQLGDNREIDTHVPMQVQGLSSTIPRPSQLMADVITVSSIAVRWQPPVPTDGVEITAYIVYWTAFGRTLESSRTVDVSTTSYVITGLDVKTRYRITVAAADLAGSETRSRPLVTRTLGLAGMEDQAITAGADHSCAVYNDAAWCWGLNTNGQLGRGNFRLEISNLIPAVVLDLDGGVTAISAGDNHNCVVQDAVAKCWGLGTNGQLGNNTKRSTATPVSVQDLSGGVTAISAGNSHSCAIVNGAAKCWGSGFNGELGDGMGSSSNTPVQVYGLDNNVTAIDVGFGFSCAIHGGAAECWGFGVDGQLGNGSGEDRFVPESVVGGLGSGVTAIAVGDSTACAVQHGVAWCWGLGTSGQLGNGATADSSIPVKVDGLDLDSSVTVITAGSFHSCAVQRGAARCWGLNTNGQLGSASVESMSSIPVLVDGLDSGVTAIAAGTSHTCAIQYDFIKCWGSNGNGQLGNGSTVNVSQPIQVQAEELNPLTAPLQLEVSGVTSQSISVRWTAPDIAEGVFPITTYTVSWGVDLDDPDNPSTATSVPVRMTSYVITDLNGGTLYQIVVTVMSRGGTGPRSTILMGMTELASPTAPRELNLGTEMTNSIAISWKPPVSTGGTAITIMEYIVYWREVVDDTNEFTMTTVLGSARSHMIGGLDAGRSYQIAVAAVNSEGITGPRSEVFSRTLFLPPRALMLEGVTTNSIAVNWQLPVLTDGVEITAYIVYWAAFSQTLESSKTVNVSTTSYVITGLNAKTRYRITVAVANLAGPGARSTPLVARTLGLAAMEAQAIAASASHSCAVYNDAAWCWGNNDFGQLGYGRLSGNEPISAVVRDLDSGVTAISIGDFNSCAIQDAAAKCWGLGVNGQLGDDKGMNSSTPVQVQEGLNRGVTAISVGDLHSCAIQDGAAKCWGEGSSGQLGDGGDRQRSNTPVQVDGLDNNVTAIVAGNEYSCAIHGGAAKCWGSGGSGQLGDGNSRSTVMAVQVQGLDGDVTAISAGGNHGCAVQRGIAWCWGSGTRGQLGNGETADSSTPVQVDGLGRDSSVTVITAGALHSCAVQRGEAWCWGSNRFDQLGSGSSRGQDAIPISVRGLDSGVTAIAAGSRHTCAIQYGVTKCWGSGGNGRLGTGRFDSSNTPLQVTGQSFSAPPQLLPGTVTGYSIAVSWSSLVLATDVPAIASYLISWGTNLEDEEGLRTTSVLVPTTNYVVSGLRPETAYQIAVAGVNRVGIGNRSTLTIQTAQVELPLAPQALRLADVMTNTLVVSWERSNFDGGDPVTTYTISWDVSTPVSGVSTAVSIAASENGNEIYEITGLLPNRLYYIVVTAANSRGSGAGSSITAQTAALLPVPPIVMVPTGEDIMSNQLRISWAASSRGSDGAEITGYVVYWTEFGQVLELRSTVNAPITSYVISGLRPGTTYQITVAAVNRSGVGRRSIPLEVRTLGLVTTVGTDYYQCWIYS